MLAVVLLGSLLAFAGALLLLTIAAGYAAGMWLAWQAARHLP
jgi:hypothetical protein